MGHTAGLSTVHKGVRLPFPFIFLSPSFSEGAADERAHHSCQIPIKCIKGNLFGFLACFERKRWQKEQGRYKIDPG